MKLILSRKGFDSGYGKMPSPILPDVRLVPLPIPSPSDRFTLADINVPDLDLDQLLRDLSQGAHTLQTNVHLDPDLDRSVDSRLPGWRPALGQTGSAQSHLRDNEIGAGDLFLFFGWFREIENYVGTWRYVRNAPHLHVMFGWIEVADVLPVECHFAVLGPAQCGRAVCESPAFPVQDLSLATQPDDGRVARGTVALFASFDR